MSKFNSVVLSFLFLSILSTLPGTLHRGATFDPNGSAEANAPIHRGATFDPNGLH